MNSRKLIDITFEKRNIYTLIEIVEKEIDDYKIYGHDETKEYVKDLRSILTELKASVRLWNN